MAIEVGYGPGQMPYTAVMPRSGNRYVYDKEGRRYQVPTDFQGGEFQGQEFIFRENLPDLSRPVDMGDKKIQPITPNPGGELISPPTPQPTIPASEDPSQRVQAQVGAAMRQPTLPQGTAVTPGLALQAPTAATTVDTQGLTGEVQATTPTATTAPTITPTTVPSAAQIAQQPQVTAPQYQAVTGQAVPQMTAAQGVVSQPAIAQQEDLTALPPSDRDWELLLE